MQYLWWSLLAVLVVVVLAVGVTLWHNWTIFLHVFDKKLLIELRGFGFRKKLYSRDFSKKKAEAGPGASLKKAKSKKQKPIQKKNGFSERWEKDKKRIYDKEKGGYQHGGLTEVLGEYREIYREAKDVIHTFLDDTRHRIEISSLWIRLDFGTGNPAHTGMLYGTIWNLVGLGYPFLVRYFKAAYPSLEVTPDFYRPRFDLEIKSIIKVRPAHIINAVCKQVGWSAITYVKQYFTKGSVKHG
ncbi:MAG: DUF2953 domain-containing protein [Clostridia bacterium]|nr:DUF2953 domain-containing protein [Clostridia bacterium]